MQVFAAEAKKPLPPMLQQYLECKQLHPDTLILYQVGDFYEAFFDDAVVISRTLNLTLTSRDKSADNPIPMAGVPLAVVDNYSARLVDAGLSVAIYSQVSTDGKTFDRKLERIITPGIRILSNIADNSKAAIVLAVIPEKNANFCLVFSAIQDGKILCRSRVPAAQLLSEVSRIAPVEIVIPADFDRRHSWVRELEVVMARTALKFRVISKNSIDLRDLTKISGFSSLDAESKQALNLLLSYVDEVTVGNQLQFISVSEEQQQDCLLIDASTRRNLELLEGQWTGVSDGSLYSTLNKTQTIGGARLLANAIARPLKDINKIEARLNLVQFFLEQSSFRAELNRMLRGICDLERIAARIQLRAILPNELAAARSTLALSDQLDLVITEFSKKGNLIFPELLLQLQDGLTQARELAFLLNSTISDNPPVSLKEPGIFKSGYHQELDRIVDLCSGGSQIILDLEKAAQQKTNIASLKVKFNNVLGYYFEVTKQHSHKMPVEFISRQSTSNTERFFTEELKAIERDVSRASGQRLELERKLYDQFRDELVKYVAPLRLVAEALSYLDMLLGFAQVSEQNNYIRPVLKDDQDLIIKDGRHPVIAERLGKDFIANSLELIKGKHNFIVLTGPNMGGKSTYLRQAALLVIMAQVGCFVSAASAQIGICDRIFARIGASDNLLEGQSTFMLEMREASQIMKTATPASLILIDELGRGTATSDGLALAQATIEWLHTELSARTIFATHFYELTELESNLPYLINLSVASVESEGDVVFTHEIRTGPANCSYGVEVARMAGLPDPLLIRARELLQEFSSGNNHKQVPKQLTFFSNQLQNVNNSAKHRLDAELASLLKNSVAIDINELTPIQAMQQLDLLLKEARSKLKN